MDAQQGHARTVSFGPQKTVISFNPNKENEDSEQQVSLETPIERPLGAQSAAKQPFKTNTADNVIKTVAAINALQPRAPRSGTRRAKRYVDAVRGDRNPRWARQPGVTAPRDGDLTDEPGDEPDPASLGLPTPPPEGWDDDLRIACWRGDVETVERMWRAELGGADAACETSGYVSYAAISGSIVVIAWLKRQGVDIDVPDQLGSAPLFFAAYHGQGGTAMWLLREGARPDRRNAAGQSPTDAARDFGHASLASVIDDVIEAGGLDAWMVRQRVMSGLSPHDTSKATTAASKTTTAAAAPTTTVAVAAGRRGGASSPAKSTDGRASDGGGEQRCSHNDSAKGGGGQSQGEAAIPLGSSSRPSVSGVGAKRVPTEAKEAVVAKPPASSSRVDDGLLLVNLSPDPISFDLVLVDEDHGNCSGKEIDCQWCDFESTIAKLLSCA